MHSRKEPRGSGDFFPTPPWATRALCRWLELGRTVRPLNCMTVWEPACGAGHMARPLAEHFARVIASDVEPRGFGLRHDFLGHGITPEELHGHDWIITNPPFEAELFNGFFERTWQYGKPFAFLMRTAAIEGVRRYERIFSDRAPHAILQFCERVPMVKNRCVRRRPDGKPQSTMTGYAWWVWHEVRGSGPSVNRRVSSVHWIPPSRAALERPGDYDDDSPAPIAGS